MIIPRRFLARHTPAYLNGPGRHLAPSKRLLNVGSSVVVLVPLALAVLLSPGTSISGHAMTLPAMAAQTGEGDDVASSGLGLFDYGQNFIPHATPILGPEGSTGEDPTWLALGQRTAEIPEGYQECYDRARAMELKTAKGGYDKNGLALMIRDLFTCMATVDGLAEEPPTRDSEWNGAELWGFENLAQQVGAEAVVVAYCESIGFRANAVRGNNKWGYGGVFQMGGNEMKTYGRTGMSKFDPVDNSYAAARYFLAVYRNGASWGGWKPWAVVNTRFNDPINNQVKVPVLPRFYSTDRRYLGRRGPELPDWAVFPDVFEVPARETCPFSGREWEPSVLLD